MVAYQSLDLQRNDAANVSFLTHLFSVATTDHINCRQARNLWLAKGQLRVSLGLAKV
jgi:hypothetical protein